MTNCTCDTFTSATSATATNTSTGHAAYFSQTAAGVDTAQTVNNSASNSALFAYQEGNGNALSAQALGSGMALYAWNTGSGTAIVASGNTGSGISASSSGTNGVYGSSSSSMAAAIYGVSTGSSGMGVEGVCNAASGFGVYGSNNVAGGTAIKGLASGNSSSSCGVFGVSNYGNGVYGFSTSGYGVYAVSSGTALYCSGGVTITGYLSKSGGGYRIDHPMDPENRFLNHNFVESPDMKNVYDGVILLDNVGSAVVNLPSYFEAANSDFRYQLTAVGCAMPNLYVSKEISQNCFVISGGVAGQKVSWQITGIRADKWAKANLPAVEIEKVGDEKGRYLHPELFGKDVSLSLVPHQK